MKSVEKHIFIFLLGGFGYGFLEMLFRGFTHWSMIITGGSSLLVLYLINQALPHINIIVKSIIGCAVITVIELSVGIIVNKIYSFGVWDYSGTPGNILGVISPRFSLVWFIISFVMLSVFISAQKISTMRKS